MNVVRTQGPLPLAAAATQTFTVSATVPSQWLVAVISVKSATIGVGTVTGGGGTWTRIGTHGVVSGSVTRVEIWENRTASSSTTTITATATSSTVAMTLTLFEGTGGDTARASESASGGDALSDTSWDGGTLTPSAGSWLLISAATPNVTGGTTRTVDAVAAGWGAALYNVPTSTLHMSCVTARSVTANGSTAYGNTFTGNGSQTNGYQLVAIPTTGGTEPPATYRTSVVLVGL